MDLLRHDKQGYVKSPARRTASDVRPAAYDDDADTGNVDTTGHFCSDCIVSVVLFVLG